MGRGSLTWGDDDSAWLYCRADAGGVTGAGYLVLIDEDFAADMLDTTNSAAGFGQRVGVAAAAVGASQYFWAQVRGVAAIRVAASAAANAALNATATAGQVDDDATSGAEVIDGLVLTTANGGRRARRPAGGRDDRVIPASAGTGGSGAGAVALPPRLHGARPTHIRHLREGEDPLAAARS